MSLAGKMVLAVLLHLSSMTMYRVRLLKKEICDLYLVECLEASFPWRDGLSSLKFPHLLVHVELDLFV